MGFYDLCCAVSGLSAVISRVQLFLMVEHDTGSFAPICLPIEGTYNRMGSIQHIQENPHTQATFSALYTALEEGQLTHEEGWDDVASLDLERLLQQIEDGNRVRKGVVRLDGNPLVFTMVIDEMYHAAIQAVRELPDFSAVALEDLQALDTESLRSLALGETPEAQRFGLGANPDAARDALIQFVQFRAWLEANSKWYYQRERDPSKHSLGGDELFEFYKSSFERYRNDPFFLPALHQYRKQVLTAIYAPIRQPPLESLHLDDPARAIPTLTKVTQQHDNRDVRSTISHMLKWFRVEQEERKGASAPYQIIRNIADEAPLPVRKNAPPLDTSPKSKSTRKSSTPREPAPRRVATPVQRPAPPSHAFDAPARAYQFMERFSQGDVITHPTFGLGVVESCLPEDKIQVFFREEGRKILVHGRG